MKHNLRVSVSKTPQNDGISTCRDVTIRERLFRFLLGNRQHITVLIPDDTIKELSICETTKGGKEDEDCECP